MSIQDVLHLEPSTDMDDRNAAEAEDEYISPLFDSDEEDLMGESVAQFNLIKYMSDLLSWNLPTLHLGRGWFAVGNLVIRQPGHSDVCPDVSVFEGISESAEELENITSWNMAKPGRPAPIWVLEVASDRTWREDLNSKPARYGQLGVREYFAFDPRSRAWKGPRLRGWRYDAVGQFQPIEADEQGRLYSQTLGLWLVPQGRRLYLYDEQGRLFLEQEMERAAMQALLEKLRQHNIDPDKL